MPNQEHVCLAITKSDIMGGAQKYVLTLARHYLARGLRVTVLTGGNGVLVDELEKAGIPVVRLKNAQRDVSMGKELGLARELYGQLRRLRPDVLHLNSSKIGVMGAVVGRLARVPHVVFTAHGWAFNEERPGYQKVIFYLMYWLTVLACDKTICVSKKTRQQIAFLPGTKNRTVAVYNGIDTPDFLSRDEARIALGERFPYLDAGKRWVAVLAELHPTKAHGILIDAVASITSEMENWQILCLGTGQLSTKLPEMVRQKSLEKYVSFGGFLKDASSYLKAFDLSVLPSLTEALPLSVLEAGLAGVPVVASAVGGIPEIITSGKTGFLSRPGDAPDLASQLRAALTLSPALHQEMASGIRHTVMEKFSIEDMVEKTLAVYKE